MKEEHSSFFQNTQCRYFPCHDDVDKAEFNCMFCYCPLYALGNKCGGKFRYNEEGNKVCSACSFPHKKENFQAILNRYPEIMELIRQNDKK